MFLHSHTLVYVPVFESFGLHVCSVPHADVWFKLPVWCCRDSRTAYTTSSCMHVISIRPQGVYLYCNESRHWGDGQTDEDGDDGDEVLFRMRMMSRSKCPWMNDVAGGLLLRVVGNLHMLWHGLFEGIVCGTPILPAFLETKLIEIQV